MGRRVSRTYSTSTTTYVYDGAHIIAEYTDGSLTKKYIYGPGIDNPVAMVNVSGTNQTWYYYYADALGSVRLMTNASGTPVESYTYDPYGQPRVMTGAGADNNWLTEDVATQDYSSIGNSILFTGRWWDSTTKLYYYRFRDYSPALGRFLQPDPLGYIDGMSLYAYVNNNPLNWVDPWGLWSWRNAGRGALIGAGGGAAAGVYSLAAGPIGVKAFVLRVLIGAVSGAIIGGNTDDGPGLVDQRNQQIDDILSDDSGKCP